VEAGRQQADDGVGNPKGVGARTFDVLRIYPRGVMGSSPSAECAPKLRRESGIGDPADPATRGVPQRNQGRRLSDEHLRLLNRRALVAKKTQTGLIALIDAPASMQLALPRRLKGAAAWCIHSNSP
jgi:hypothetical protein